MIHASADVDAGAVVGDGTIIWQHAHIREGARLGRDCVIGKGAYVDAGVVIGDNCKVQNNAQVFAPAVLEDGVFVGPAALLLNDRVPRAVQPDGSPKRTGDWSPSGVTVRAGAALGGGSVIVPGVTVGRWALVAAGATVVSDVPDHGLVMGVPARLVGFVCACGARLDTADPTGQWRCAGCLEQLNGQAASTNGGQRA